MRDNPVHRAYRQGAHTVPVDPAARSKRIRDNPRLAPDEIQLAVEMARSDRVEQDIRDYAYRKGQAS